MYIHNIKVDEFQEKAILCPSNCLLIAGAGAGKTFTILGKINYILEKKLYQESEILLLSFTNKSVDDLKRKLPYPLDIFTFHKLAMQILKDYQITFSLAPPNMLEYLTDEFFHTLTDEALKKEILNFYKEWDYASFLTSFKYQQLCKTIITFIRLYKTNDCTLEDLKKTFAIHPFMTKLILIILKLYENELASSQQMDFDDLIKQATLALTKFYKYKYIIIDEFQDTSLLRWNLVDKLRILNHAIIFAVGDDFQSIYHFSGCNVDLFLNFDKIVPNATLLKLKYTYRNSQSLINIAGKFILKNKRQMDKELRSNKDIKNPVRYCNYLYPSKGLEKILNQLIDKYEDILILQRNNKDIDLFLSTKMQKNEDSILYKKKSIRLLTVHSSKGLEADVVILINLTNSIMGFPSQLTNPKVIDSINTLEDTFLFAEERRLFYVALTRTKNEVYLLTPFIKKSVFVKELKKITSSFSSPSSD